MISTLLNAGVEGLNRGRQGLDQTAKAITEIRPITLSSSYDRAAVEDAVVSLKMYEVQFKSSAKVVETADQLAGTLIDESV